MTRKDNQQVIDILEKRLEELKSEQRSDDVFIKQLMAWDRAGWPPHEDLRILRDKARTEAIIYIKRCLKTYRLAIH